MSKALEVCYGCKHHQETAIFRLCMHPSSKYVVADKEDQHTCAHMRAHSACGEQHSLFEART